MVSAGSPRAGRAGAAPAFPPGDYVSPGYATVRLDEAFPDMIVGDPGISGWPYLRGWVPHNWYVDRRAPQVGFLNRDEAHVLYNNALRFRGRRGLEIGCWLGWSAAHLALAGLDLDVVDPLLRQSDFMESVRRSLTLAAGSRGLRVQVRLVPGTSPDTVASIAASENRKWSFMFVDGDHESPGPARDAAICDAHTEADAMVMFHDLAAPRVRRDRGWRTMVYQTMQIMGVAWRGDTSPVGHRPDPAVAWSLPDHLDGWPVSNGADAGGAGNGVQAGSPANAEAAGPLAPHRDREWRSAIPPAALASIQSAAMRYAYRGVPMIKNPFDFALYPRLIWRLAPGTILEIGSFQGGSALWFGDLLDTYGLDARVYSVDVNAVSGVEHPRVEFLLGNARNLGETLDPAWVRALPRPLLVIEDADHYCVTTRAVLDFFHGLLSRGDYIVIEDGIVDDLGESAHYGGGPNRAIAEFLDVHGDDYAIDTEYCDYFGPNFTWCTNGFLRRISDGESDGPAGDGSAGDRSAKDGGRAPPVPRGGQADGLADLLEVVAPYTLLGEERLTRLFELARQACVDDVPGAFVECGAYKGGAVALLAHVAKRHGRRPREVWAFDTFAGLPAPGEVDRHRGLSAASTGFDEGALPAPIETNIRAVCDTLGVSDIVRIVPGLFADTLPAHVAAIGDIALLHADGDWYESTRQIFEHLFGSVVPDGFVQIDDYGHWEGCRKAVDEFAAARDLDLDLRWIDYTGVWFRRT